MTDKPRVISVSGLRLTAEYILNVIAEAINSRTLTVRYKSSNGLWESPAYVGDNCILILQAYEIIQNGTMLEVI